MEAAAPRRDWAVLPIMAAKTGTKAAQALMKADAAALRASRAHRQSAAVNALAWYSELGDQPPLRAISGGLILVGLLRGDGRMARAGARMLAAHSLATGAKNFVKRRVDRTRPRSASGKDGHKMKAGRSKAKEETSFPSGHSAGAITVAQAFAREYPEYRVPALGAAGLVALAQIPRCAHYPTDVGAGLAIGLAAEAAVDAVWPFHH